MRPAFLIAAALATMLLGGCAGSARTAGAGSSTPPAAAQTCEEAGLAPATAEFRRCMSTRRQAVGNGTRAVMDTLFRATTESPIR